MIRHIIFDLDGTLVDSSTICVEILTGMLRERGYDQVIDPRYARQFMSRGGTQMVTGLLGEACQDPETDLADFRRRYASTATPREALYPGVAGGIANLSKAGFKLSICSNKPQNLCDQVLEDTGLASWFDVVVGGGPGLRPKPEPDLLEATLKSLRSSPGECLFVGDSELDHQIAEAACIPFLFVTYGYAQPGWDAPAEGSFDCFERLVNSVLAGVAPARAA
jgi:phosphoglycolate phosphatase